MPKLNLVLQNDPMERLTVNIREKVLEQLDLYKQMFEARLGGKLQLNYLVEEMLKTVMKEDKDFTKFLAERESRPTAAKSTQRSEAPAAPVAAAPAANGNVQ
jgi:hypothetical protein